MFRVGGPLLGNTSVPGPEVDVGDTKTSKMQLGLKWGWPVRRPLKCVKCETMTWRTPLERKGRMLERTSRT